jgi:hypothetical protein
MLDNFISEQASQPAPVTAIEIGKPELVAAEPLNHANVPEVYQPEIEAPHMVQESESIHDKPLSGDIQPSYLAENEPEMQQPEMLDDRSATEVSEDENSDLYSINNFTL